MTIPSLLYYRQCTILNPTQINGNFKVKKYNSHQYLDGQLAPTAADGLSVGGSPLLSAPFQGCSGS